MPEHYDAIILGAGGAGLMAAATAGQLGKRVLLLDHADKPGKKILISGGGRCNFTNIGTAPERFLSANKHFAKSALSRYTAQDFIDLVSSHGIAYHEKTLGQLFCDGSARQIVRMLLDECEKGSVTLRLGEPLTEIAHRDARFNVNAASASALIVATGGPSIPKMGATSGVATEVIAQTAKTSFREAALFTHKGLSGPAILQISSYWQSGAPIALNMLPATAPGALTALKREMPKRGLRAALSTLLPDRLAEALAAKINDTKELANWSDKALNSVEDQLKNWPFHPNGTEGYAKAEVTAGGVSTADLNSSTMEAKSVPGLYFIGEAVDVTGWLGGYNFQWAWSSGVAAARAL